MRLAALNRRAMELGLTVDENLADALATLPGLAVHDHDAAADADFLDRIADGCMRFTPMVAVEGPDAIILDITGSAHLFGGEEGLRSGIHAWLNARRIEARSAYGASAESAHALARFHRGDVTDEAAAIRALPVTALDLDPESDLGLRRAGLKTIGDVMDRPRHVIAARFGAASVYRLDRLTGAQNRPIDARPPPPVRTFPRRLPEPVLTKDHAMAVLRELLAEANASLVAEHLGGRAFEARFSRVDGLVRRLAVETGLPTRDAAAIMRLFDERLDGIADPLDPGFGFDGIELAVLKSEPLKPKQEGLDRKTGGSGALAETLDMLAVRLGRSRLLRFRPVDTHIPENAQKAVPAIEAARGFEWQPVRTGGPPARPLQLFDPPQRIAVIAEIPDGPPRRFRWRRKLRDVVRHEGPERIAAEWWKSPLDPLGRKQLTRDYYRIEDADGRRYWVFRHGLYGRESDDPDWYLHGLFA